MKTIRELREQVQCYEEVLAQLQKPFRTAQEETAVQLFTRLLFDANNVIKKLEQNSVKLHSTAKSEADVRPQARLRERLAAPLERDLPRSSEYVSERGAIVFTDAGSGCEGY